MARKRGSRHKCLSESNNKFNLSLLRKPVVSSFLLLFVIYFVSTSSNFSRLYAYNQQLELLPVILESQTTTTIQQPVTFTTLDNGQQQQQSLSDPYIGILDTNLVSSSDRSKIGETRFFNCSLPKNESSFVDSPFKEESKSLNMTSGSIRRQDLLQILDLAESKNTPVITVKSTNKIEENNIIKQQARRRRASATKLKNLIPIAAANNKTISKSRYLPIVNGSKLLEAKVDIRKRLDLVADSTSLPVQARTMVLVTTKSRKFSELVPLDELIVAPTNVNQDMNLIRPIYIASSPSVGHLNGDLQNYLGNSNPDDDDDDYDSNRQPNIGLPLLVQPTAQRRLIQVGHSNNALETSFQPHHPNLRPDEDNQQDDDGDGDNDDNSDMLNPITLAQQNYNYQKQDIQPHQYSRPHNQQQLMASSLNAAMDKRIGLQALPNHSGGVGHSYIRNTKQDLNFAAGHHYKKKKPKKKKHHHDHGKYYMYAKVPKKGAWEFGYKKGNKKHKIERHEKGHKSHFKTKVKWEDKKSKGKGIHIWDYNHFDKKKKKY